VWPSSFSLHFSLSLRDFSWQPWLMTASLPSAIHLFRCLHSAGSRLLFLWLYQFSFSDQPDIYSILLCFLGLGIDHFTITVHFRDYLVLMCLSIKWYLFPHLDSLSCLWCALCPQY
jgi:hypothetical protein